MAIGVLVVEIAAFVASDAPGIPGFSTQTDVAFAAKVDGSTQRYVEMLPSKFRKNRRHDLMIAFHGHGSDRWQFVRDQRDECRAARDVAVKHDMIFISPDYRSKTSWMGPKAESDVVQIIHDLRAKHIIRKVFLVGASMGGASVLTFAVLHPELVDGVCSENGTANHVEYQNFQDAIVESFGGTKQQVPEEYRKRSAELFPEKLTMPIAFTTGGKDAYVPPQSVLRLVEILRCGGRKVLLIHREQGGHSTTYDDAVTAMEFVVREASAKR